MARILTDVDVLFRFTLMGMAMAVAVKTTPVSSTFPRADRLSIGILAGVLYVLASIGVVAVLLPKLWWEQLHLPVNFLYATLLGVLLLAATGVLSFVGLRLMGKHPAHGLRAGIFCGLLAFLLVLLVARWASLWIEHWAFQGYLGPMAGAVITGIVFAVLLVAVGGLFIRSKTHKKLQALEDQGWFTSTPYKRSQGRMVRRGTIFGLVLLAGCGIFTLLEHKTLEAGPRDWTMGIPFTGMVTLETEGDARGLIAAGPIAIPADKLFVRITNKGDSNLEPGQVVSDAAFQEAVSNSLKGEGKRVPEGQFATDRFTLRAFEERFRQNFVKIEKEGELPLEARYARGAVLERTEYDKAVQKLKEDNKDLPTATTPDAPWGKVQYASLTILPNVQYTLPLLLAALTFWLAYRMVNVPVFADFLIATEAELNKVSWTTRSRLVQDTIVVLITVVFMAIMLLVVDTAWYYLLSSRYIRVLQIDRTQAPEQVNKEKPW
jgi:preprotein translocase SecE subunit